MIKTWQPIFDKAILPIYRQDHPGCAFFYTPGWLAVVPTRLASEFQVGISNPARAKWKESLELRDHSLEAQKNWLALQTAPFIPVCLTLYLTNDCNLNCIYCFSQPYRSGQAYLDPGAVREAAEIVAQNCCEQQRPLTVVFHGGGEPTLDYELTLHSLQILDAVAIHYGLRLFRYIATNGIMSQARAADLSSRFDLIGLSCDGPPEIQNRQRLLRNENKHASSLFVEQTARLVDEAGKPLHVRVTITPETMDRQVEISEYICRTLKPQEIHVEPVYSVEHNGKKNSFHLEQAENYVSAFLAARNLARAYGVRWLASGSRPTEIHGAYCHTARNVLNLTPDGVATLCFKLSDATSVRQQSMDLGEWDPSTGHFRWNAESVQNSRHALQYESEECACCFNRYHCARQCPDVCLLKPGASPDGFRCQVQSRLTDAYIKDAADVLCSNTDLMSPVLGKISAQG